MDREKRVDKMNKKLILFITGILSLFPVFAANASNVAGWDDLLEGHLPLAIYSMYNAALLGWSVVLLFFVFQIMLIIKTRKINLCWITGFLFASLYAASSFIHVLSLQIIGGMLIIELAGIIFLWFFKK